MAPTTAARAPGPRISQGSQVSWFEQAGMTAFRRIDPELAHGLALKALGLGLAPLPGQITSPRLATRLAGLALPNPIGLAAGMD